jgi:hypothetical protein
MKWPRSLNIKGTTYKIEYKKEVLCSDGKPADGTCDGASKIIEVCTDCSNQRIAEILFHEMGHAVEFELGLEHIRDQDSGPYELHALIDHMAKEIIRNWDKLSHLKII